MRFTRRERLNGCGVHADVFRREHQVWLGGRGIKAEFLGAAQHTMAKLRNGLAKYVDSTDDRKLILPRVVAEGILSKGWSARLYASEKSQSEHPAESAMIAQVHRPNEGGGSLPGGGLESLPHSSKSQQRGGRRMNFAGLHGKLSSAKFVRITPPAVQPFALIVKCY